MDLVRVHIFKMRIVVIPMPKIIIFCVNISFENDIIFRCEVYVFSLLKDNNSIEQINNYKNA